MHKFLLIAAVALAFVPAAATPARAGCLEEAIESCNKDFPGTDVYSSAIRGWCYIIRTGMCEVLDEPIAG